MNGIFPYGQDRTGFTRIWALKFLEKIITCPNEANHDDCAVAFTGDMFQQTFNKISLIWKKCDWVHENMGIHIFGKKLLLSK